MCHETKCNGALPDSQNESSAGRIGRPGISQCRAAHARIGIGPHDRGDGVLVVASVVFGREEIRAAAIFTDIGLVRNLPIANPGAALFIVQHHVVNELFPFLVAGRIHDLLVDGGIENLRLEVDVHERRGAGFPDQVHGFVERFPVVAAVVGEQIEILLDEEPDHARMQVANLGDAIGPHRLFGEAALAQSKAIDLEGPAVSLRFNRSGTVRFCEGADWPTED